MIKNHLLGGGRTCPAGNWHLLAVKWSIFGRRRLRRSNESRNNAQSRKLRLKANYQVRENEKIGIFNKFRNFPRFEHFTALGNSRTPPRHRGVCLEIESIRRERLQHGQHPFSYLYQLLFVDLRRPAPVSTPSILWVVGLLFPALESPAWVKFTRCHVLPIYLYVF